MSKDRDLIFDMTEDPEVLTYPAADNEPLQLGGVGDDAAVDAAAAADRQVTTPGDVHVAPQMPAPIDGTLRQFALRVPSVIDECSAQEPRNKHEAGPWNISGTVGDIVGHSDNNRNTGGLPSV